MKGIHAIVHQVCDARGEHFCFSATRPSDDHERTIDVLYCLALLFIQPRQIIPHGRKLHACGRKIGLWAFRRAAFFMHMPRFSLGHGRTGNLAAIY